jgi:hypothetical protein
MANNPELVDFLSFFESEPQLVTPGMEWYDGARFSSQRGEDKIVATVAPDEGEFSFQWWRGEKQHADIQLNGVAEWELETSANNERLVLKFNEPRIPFFILQLKPHISISWRVSWA